MTAIAPHAPASSGAQGLLSVTIHAVRRLRYTGGRYFDAGRLRCDGTTEIARSHVEFTACIGGKAVRSIARFAPQPVPELGDFEDVRLVGFGGLLDAAEAATLGSEGAAMGLVDEVIERCWEAAREVAVGEWTAEHRHGDLTSLCALARRLCLTP